MNDARQELIARIGAWLTRNARASPSMGGEVVELLISAHATAVALQEDKLKRLYEAADILLIELDAAQHDSRDASDCDICRATDKFRQTFYTMADITVSTPCAPAAVARQEIPREPTEAML